MVNPRLRNIRVHSTRLGTWSTLDVCTDTEDTTTPGAFVWGDLSDNQRLSNIIFASTECRLNGDDGTACKHLALDASVGRAIYSFKNDEQGDALALSPKGKHFYPQSAIIY